MFSLFYLKTKALNAVHVKMFVFLVFSQRTTLPPRRTTQPPNRTTQPPNRTTPPRTATGRTAPPTLPTVTQRTAPPTRRTTMSSRLTRRTTIRPGKVTTVATAWG